MARAFYILAGLILFVMAYFSYTFSFEVLFWETRPFTILAIPLAFVGTLLIVYALIAGRKIRGGKK